MCNNLVCKVCGGQGVNQRFSNPYYVTLCDDHFNELHELYQDKKARKVFLANHLANRKFHKDGTGKKEFNAWADAEHKFFVFMDGIVKKMQKEWAKHIKKNPPPEPKPSDDVPLVR